MLSVKRFTPTGVGTIGGDNWFREGTRFTPTVVGTITSLPLWTPLQPVHPHGRGDNYVIRTLRNARAGSPPRAWGQYGGHGLANRVKRFTPTGVGTMVVLSDTIRGRAVHPHGRGDNRGRRVGCGAGGGSPPRAWGQCARATIGRTSMRFTPTGVGTIRRPARQGIASSVHPHGRGDNQTDAQFPIRSGGSPPRAWGQSDRRAISDSVRRFTPTGVGTMLRRSRAPWSATVHPHGRGDNSETPSRHAISVGSPPRAWGQWR